MKGELIIPIETTHRIKDTRFLADYICDELEMRINGDAIGGDPDTYIFQVQECGVSISVSPKRLSVVQCKSGVCVMQLDVQDMLRMTYRGIMERVYEAIGYADILSFCFEQGESFCSRYGEYLRQWMKEICESGTQTRCPLGFEDWMAFAEDEEAEA